MNNNEVIKILKDNCINISEIMKVYYCNNKLNIFDIKDCIGNIVFNCILDTQGYLIFIDCCTIANWSHKCLYLFVTDNEEIFIKEGQWFPKDNIKLIEVLNNKLIY